MAERDDRLHVTEGDTTLPAIDVLTGRGFVTGKSGSGKSNTASVLVEELLDLDSRLLIVDTDGEYYGLKEDYEVLHLGASDRCDAVVGPEDAEAIADIALAEGVPVVLDVSGFLEGDDADRLVYEVAKHLFSMARDVRQPFLLLVEEVHEFVPEQGGLGDVGEMIVRVAKRGRKRGLGMCGLSQRPASVDKDFITQCDWLAWHRLTWANDTRVVDSILGGSYSTDVESLGDGEAFLVADWMDSVERVQFRRKHTYDAGATPGYGETADPDLKPVSDKWLARFRDDTTSSTSADADSSEDAGTDDSATDDTGTDDADTDDAAAAEAASQADADESESADAGASRSAGGSSGGTARASTATDGTPPSDARTAVWEFGQLVAHLAVVGARQGSRVLARWTQLAARSADGATQRLGFWARDVSSRTVAVLKEQTASSTASGNGPTTWRPDTRARPKLDRAVGAALVLSAVLVVIGAYAVV